MSAVNEDISGRLVTDRHPADAPGGAEVLAALVARAASGEQAAWGELVGRYARRVYALARSRLHDPDQAEEVAQSVFASVFQHVSSGRYAERGQFEPWLFRVTMNRVRDEVRRRSRRPGLTLVRESDALLERSGESESDEIHRLRDAVASLGEADREIIGLRHHAGLEFRAIAEMLGEPVGTLLARHHRALHKLRAILGSAASAAGARHE